MAAHVWPSIHFIALQINMATAKTAVKTRMAAPDEKTVIASSKRNDSVIDRVLGLLSSVRFGIIMLMLLLLCCIVGMFIMQQNVGGFREYYAGLSPAQRNIYETLGFFDIYHSWYFTLLLAITGLNIVLSSIDRFPAAWAYIRKPRLSASPKFIRAQIFNKTSEMHGNSEAVAELIAAQWRKRSSPANQSRRERRNCLRRAQRVESSRSLCRSRCAVDYFVGGFLTSRYGIGGSMEIIPGQSSNRFMTFRESSFRANR